MECHVCLADLRHNYMGVLANDCMPLGVACMKAVMDRDLHGVHSRLFAYPDRLWDAMKETPPHVLMLSNYVWNESLGLRFAELAKALNPDTLVVMGGPNMSLDRDRQIAFANAYPAVDIYVLGEGDFLATEIVRRYLEEGLSIPRLMQRGIPSSVYRRPDGEVVVEDAWDRHRAVDEIPSPWLSGIQDEFFDGRLAPMIETNRGCPFTCTFCVQGTRWYTKVHNFSLERITAELRYIAERIRARSPQMGTLRIADSNYGMFERDVEISAFLGGLQKEYGWPTFIDATTGKNRPDRIIQSVEHLSGALVLYQAVQSLDEDVLRNVKRSTIKLEAYEQLQIHMRGRGLRSNSDLILGLPGETLKTHLAAIHKLLNAEINQVHNFQLMMLKGSELETTESRRAFSFESRFRVLPKNCGVYADRKVVGVEEIVVATDTLSFDDYLKARTFHLTSSVFQNDGWFERVIAFASRFGVTRSEWWDAMFDGLTRAEGVVGAFVKNFIRETVNELFPTREACVDFYMQDGNFRLLLDGDIGDNLMYKYRAIASFHHWPDICRIAMDQTRTLLLARGAASTLPDFECFWQDFTRYETAKHAHGLTLDEIVSPVQVTLRYDLERLLRPGIHIDVAACRLDAPSLFEFRLNEDNARDLTSAVAVWSMSLKGLSKLVTRIQCGWQVRGCAVLSSGATSAAA